MGLNPKNIPQNTESVYIRDKRYQKNPFRFYIFVLGVNINTHLRLVDIDEDIIETCVERLRDLGLIMLKRGRKK